MFNLTYTSLPPYFILMICFAGLASFLDFESPATETFTPHGDRFNIPLESLRGVLALGVFFHHSVTNYYFFKTGKWGPAPSPFYLLMGSAPVTMFFFLSGYLFWMKCLTQGGVGNIRSFFKARARRLLPAYFFVLIFVFLNAFVVTRFTLHEDLYKVILEMGQWATVGVPFGVFPNINGYVDTHLINAGVAWSLRYEILFYLSLPLMALLSRRHWTLVWLAFFAALYALMFRYVHSPQFVWSLGLDLINGIATFYCLGFSLGMLTAYLKVNLPDSWIASFRARAWAVAALMLLFIHFYKNFPSTSVRQSSYLIVPFIIIAFGNDIFGILSRRSLLFLGKISYSIYLVHGVVIFAFSRLLSFWIPFESLTPLSFWLFTLVNGCVAVTVSAAIYRWIELPWLTKKLATT
jgi:peptidoglycan/LPS O-acetylase OafA/YrhL